MNLYADFRKCFQWGDEILQRGYIPDFLGQTIINIRRPMIYRHFTKFLAIIVVAEYNGALLKTRGKSGSRQPDRLLFPPPGVKYRRKITEHTRNLGTRIHKRCGVTVH